MKYNSILFVTQNFLLIIYLSSLTTMRITIFILYFYTKTYIIYYIYHHNTIIVSDEYYLIPLFPVIYKTHQ